MLNLNVNIRNRKIWPVWWSLSNAEQIAIMRRTWCSKNCVPILKKKVRRNLRSHVSTWTLMQKRPLHLCSDFSVTVRLNFPRWCLFYSLQLLVLLYYSYYSVVYYSYYYEGCFSTHLSDWIAQVYFCTNNINIHF